MARQLVLLGAVGRAKPRFASSPANAGVRREGEGPRADAAAGDALERERAGVAAEAELHRPAGAGELRRRQPFELRERDVRSVARIGAPTSRRWTVPSVVVGRISHVPGNPS